MAPSNRLCACGYRYERRKRKCPSCGKAAPKKRVPKHAETLRDHTYEDYVEVSRLIHGVTDESCCVCRRPKGHRKHDRDHDHKTGNPRGLCCHRCNRMMPHWMTPHLAQLVANYLARVHNYYLMQEHTKPEGPNGSHEEGFNPV